MIETLTTAVIILAISLVGLALMFGALLSDHNRRINKIRKDVFSMEKAQRGNYARLGIIEKRVDRTAQDIDLKGIDRAINGISDKVERHEKTFKALTSVLRAARWRSFNEYSIKHEGESPRCEYCLSDGTEYDMEYANVAGSKAPDRLVSKCYKCGQKSTLWRYHSEC